MDQHQPQRRRWFHHSQRTLFIVVAICCIGLGWLGWELHVVLSRNTLLKWIGDSATVPGVICVDDFRKPAQVSWLRRLLGDHEITAIELLDTTEAQQVDLIKSAFLEAEVHLWHEMPAGGFF
jgi:hypothetical protein